MGSPNDYGLIAEDIMHIGVYMVDKEDPFSKVLEMMVKHNISAVVVEDRENLGKYYIVSHTDIIKFLYNEKAYIEQIRDFGQSFYNLKVKLIMRGPVDIIHPDTPIDRVINIMHKKGFKRVIVGNEKGQPIGIVSTRDILAWNNKYFRKGDPILICVMENDSGIILAQKFFKEEFGEELLELFGGSLSAITSITSEVLKESGNLRVIEKDFYHILLEPREQVTGVLVADYSSIDLRRKLQIFIDEFIKLNEKALKQRKKYPGSVSVFRLKGLTKIFER